MLLNSWKEIAAYLKCGVRTAQRWQRDLHMPVMRVREGKRGAVIAYSEALDEWIKRRPPALVITAKKETGSTGKRLRLKAIQTQLAAAFTYCLTAETAFVLRHPQRGRKAIENARHTAQVIRAHLEEPDHVPADSVTGIRDKLKELDIRVSKLEARLHP